MPTDDSQVDHVLQPFPSPDITPIEFEEWATGVIGSASGSVDDLDVSIHDRIAGLDGTYEFDGTVRYRLAGLDFLVVIEAKLHGRPIERELVQVLRAKVQSVGAHKGVMVSTAPYQRGALEYARAHGIALVMVTEGRFTYVERSASPSPPMTRAEAASRFGSPAFVGHAYSAGPQGGSWTVTLISSERPDSVAGLLLGVGE